MTGNNFKVENLKLLGTGSSGALDGLWHHHHHDHDSDDDDTELFPGGPSSLTRRISSTRVAFVCVNSRAMSTHWQAEAGTAPPGHASPSPHNTGSAL